VPPERCKISRRVLGVATDTMSVEPNGDEGLWGKNPVPQIRDVGVEHCPKNGTHDF